MTGDRLNADVEQYRQATATNPPPPAIVSDPLVDGGSPFDQVLRALVLAANAQDHRDHADGVEGHAEREAKAAEAAEKFAAQDEAAAAELNGAAAQQFPQVASGLAGVLMTALQPLSQIPQQLTQGAQQVLQSAAGMLGQSQGAALAPLDDAVLESDPMLDEIGSDADDLAIAGDGFGLDAEFGDLDGLAGSPGSGPVEAPAYPVAPTAVPAPALGPPPVPSASTAPAAAPATRITVPSSPTAAPHIGSGLAGMPMIPPGAVSGAAISDKEEKAQTKRVSVAPVRNGAPVQGRLIAAPATPAAGDADGKPTTARRIMVSRSGPTPIDDDRQQP